MSTDTPTTNQCSICLDGTPYDKCVGIRTSFTEVAEAASCAYLIELEAKLASAQATITGDGKVIDQYRERLASVTEERDRLKRENESLRAEGGVRQIEGYKKGKAEAEQQLAASREAVIEECAGICNMEAYRYTDDDQSGGLIYANACLTLAAAIRALSASAAKEGE